MQVYLLVMMPTLEQAWSKWISFAKIVENGV